MLKSQTIVPLKAKLPLDINSQFDLQKMYLDGKYWEKIKPQMRAVIEKNHWISCLLHTNTAAPKPLGMRDWLHWERFFHGSEGAWFHILPASWGWASVVCAAWFLACCRSMPVHGPWVGDPCSSQLINIHSIVMLPLAFKSSVYQPGHSFDFLSQHIAIAEDTIPNLVI